MAHEITMGAILIKDYALLPKELRFETEPYVPGWGLVKDFDGYRLDREIQKAGWHFFCLAGEIKAPVFGIDSQKMVRRAIGRILASPRSEGFNSLEITRMASKRFLGVPYISVGAQSRHIQESLFLLPIERSRESGGTKFSVTQAKAWGTRSAKEFASEGTNGTAVCQRQASL